MRNVNAIQFKETVIRFIFCEDRNCCKD